MEIPKSKGVQTIVSKVPWMLGLLGRLYFSRFATGCD
jgi:hypothetical protein